MAIHREVDVAHLLGGVGRLSEPSLEGEHALGTRASSILGIAEILELVRDVREVRLAQRIRALVVTRVVVALRQAEAALADVNEVAGRLVEIRRDAERVKDACRSALQVARDRAHVSDGLRGGDPVEHRLKCAYARLGDGRLVHRGCEVVADQLAH